MSIGRFIRGSCPILSTICDVSKSIDKAAADKNRVLYIIEGWKRKIKFERKKLGPEGVKRFERKIYEAENSVEVRYNRGVRKALIDGGLDAGSYVVSKLFGIGDLVASSFVSSGTSIIGRRVNQSSHERKPVKRIFRDVLSSTSKVILSASTSMITTYALCCIYT